MLGQAGERLLAGSDLACTYYDLMGDFFCTSASHGRPSTYGCDSLTAGLVASTTAWVIGGDSRL